MPRITLSIPHDLDRDLRLLSSELGVSRSALVTAFLKGRVPEMVDGLEFFEAPSSEPRVMRRYVQSSSEEMQRLLDDLYLRSVEDQA